MEIPFDLINQLQISLRRQANLPSYDPNDSSFAGDLPSAEEAAAALDPSPPYLRCRHCKGRLLRGLQSSICVFCGREAINDVVPEPINFRNTLGYQWLLNSLDLDGSEIVQASVESTNKSKRRNVTNDEFPLSEILDLDINWPSESDRFGSHLSDDKTVYETKASVDLSGVNIENFFSNEEKNKESVLFNQTHSKESTEAHSNLSLFENTQSSKTGDESNHSDSAWGASFSNVESTPFDPFVGSADLSAQISQVVGPANVESTAGDWFSHESYLGSSDPPPQEIKVDAKEEDEGNDSFDDWNDFTSSAITSQDPSDSIKQTTMPFDDLSFSGRDVSTEASVLDRSSDDVKRVRDESTVETASKSGDVETILSQMHDLSFMLDTNLSIPPTHESSKILSQD